MRRAATLIVPALALALLGGCSSGTVATDAGPDAADVADVAPDVAPDAGPDAGTDVAGTDEGGGDATPDAGPAGFPGWDLASRWTPATAPTCANPRNPTARSLAQKAGYYDWIGARLHLVPASVRPYSLVHNVTLAAPVPTDIVPDGELPAVTEYHYAENHGLWSSLFVASQAFRYATTHDPEALDTLRRSFLGLYHAMKITGVPGLFAREVRDDTLPGDACPPEGPEYAKPVDLKGNRWVRLDAQACTRYWDPAANGGAGAMVKDDPPHCVDAQYANLCWQRNCSKDESSGHNFAAAVIYALVDDAPLKTLAAEVLGALADHLLDHGYRLVDYDGIPTRYGSYFALSMDEFPGFNALHALAATRSGLWATQSERQRDGYFDCLLQQSGPLSCIDQPLEYDVPADYRTYLADDLGLKTGCKLLNYDNVNMALLNYVILMLAEGDAGLRAEYRSSFLENSKGPDGFGQDLWAEVNPHWNFLLAAMLDAGDAGTFGGLIDEARAVSMVQDGICTLRAFPETNIQAARDSTNHPETCVSSRHGSLTDQPVPIEERCTSLFPWWVSPYERQVCAADPTVAIIPSGYLLPYWAGRYLGFVPAEM